MAAKKRKRHTVPNRSDLLAALGLEPEGRTRGQKYAATTKEFYARVLTERSPAGRRARKALGISSKD